MIIIWFDDWKYQTRMVIIVMRTDIIWSLLRPAREVGGRLCSWLSYKILKIIRKFSAFSKYCLRNWETSISGLRMVTSRFWNYLQCCQLLIVLEGIRSDGGDTIAGYIAEKQVSQVTIGRIELSDISWSSFFFGVLILTFVWDSEHFWKQRMGFPWSCFSRGALTITDYDWECCIQCIKINVFWLMHLISYDQSIIPHEIFFSINSAHSSFVSGGSSSGTFVRPRFLQSTVPGYCQYSWKYHNDGGYL